MARAYRCWMALSRGCSGWQLRIESFESLLSDISRERVCLKHTIFFATDSPCPSLIWNGFAVWTRNSEKSSRRGRRTEGRRRAEHPAVLLRRQHRPSGGPHHSPRRLPLICRDSRFAAHLGQVPHVKFWTTYPHASDCQRWKKTLTSAVRDCCRFWSKGLLKLT